MSSPEEDSKPVTGGQKSLDYHREMLKNKLNDGAQKQQAFVSPSDNILSPCTKKLSAYKNKHFMKAKPQSLFAKTSSKNLDFTGGLPNMEGKQEVNSQGSSKANSVASEGL